MLGTVGRAGDLLELFDASAPEWGATAVSRQLSITKSQAHEMLVSLEAIGLLRRGGRGRFRLGWKTVSLSQRLMRSEFSAEGVGLIQELGRHIKTSVDLIAFDGDICVRIGGYGPPGDGRWPSKLNGRVDAAGKVLLAGMPESRVNEIVPGVDLALDLAAVRERGVAFEVENGRGGVAAPILAGDESVLAALGVTVSSEAWSAKRAMLTKAVIGTARRLSATIRHDAASRSTMLEPALSASSTRESLSA